MTVKPNSMRHLTDPLREVRISFGPGSRCFGLSRVGHLTSCNATVAVQPRSSRALKREPSGCASRKNGLQVFVHFRIGCYLRRILEGTGLWWKHRSDKYTCMLSGERGQQCQKLLVQYCRIRDRKRVREQRLVPRRLLSRFWITCFCARQVGRAGNRE